MSEPKKRKQRIRGHQEGTTRQRKDGRWEGRILLPDGSRPSVYGKTEADVKNQINDIRKKLNDGVDVRAGEQPLRAFLETWLNDVVRLTCRPKTIRSYEQLIEWYIVPAIGQRKLGKLTVPQVQSMLNALTDRGLAPATVTRVRDVLRNALNVALKWGYVSRNVAALVDPPRRNGNTRHAPLTLDEAKRLQEKIKGDRLEAMYLTTLSLGLRPAEVLGLRWHDLDLDAGRAHIQHTVQLIDKQWQFVEPKTAQSNRVLPLPAFLVTALRKHQQQQAEARLLAGDRWQEYGLIFPSTVGTPQLQSNVLWRFKHLCEAAGIPPRRFYDLRHSCGTFLYARGVAPRTIMEILGHSQISLTMNTYVHGVPELNKEALDTFEHLFGNGGEKTVVGSKWGQNTRRPRIVRRQRG